MCVCACVRTCVHACVRVCAHVCMRVCVCTFTYVYILVAFGAVVDEDYNILSCCPWCQMQTPKVRHNRLWSNIFIDHRVILGRLGSACMCIYLRLPNMFI